MFHHLIFIFPHTLHTTYYIITNLLPKMLVFIIYRSWVTSTWILLRTLNIILTKRLNIFFCETYICKLSLIDNLHNFFSFLFLEISYCIWKSLSYNKLYMTMEIRLESENPGKFQHKTGAIRKHFFITIIKLGPFKKGWRLIKAINLLGFRNLYCFERTSNAELKR